MVPTTESRSTEREDIAGPEIVTSPYPIFIEGEVVKGFGRGGKQLGIPTANLPETVVENTLSDISIRPSQHIPIGIYYGWAKVEKEVYPMVLSLGWNPYFHNEKRSGEVHIIHDFKDNFYGKKLKVVVLAYIRPEKDYTSIELLINDIKTDITVAQNSLL
ncbi:riboflavin kinase [Coemansia reversa NRRL 1564]|uniref:Riboflavin kinase n=1 Tax=Coemansia reversa (strain ATCC 12441 / NRRL 1564) TaxID=763665 RepID=A0A2G5B3D4_COERN|nr:riboflavin kinase [Coemansia reversa NRRL 1564]|eukprot:PIA13533.1 riboflavin kinase [Coemansia reversa NRRL 1564]